ncbi:hypothetical protein Bpfe_006724 [Biomphalaria pfeifferi]|uniref:Uncharacterized protein n=1 Tax=Biomphalaria pfeifferi TaxID=112525 RepID=A0AAD8FI69_BIOPF|nr:hypothetical protein Bpfe_006724 [Biomphalaria pfeifferi]
MNEKSVKESPWNRVRYGICVVEVSANDVEVSANGVEVSANGIEVSANGVEVSANGVEDPIICLGYLATPLLHTAIVSIHAAPES